MVRISRGPEEYLKLWWDYSKAGSVLILNRAVHSTEGGTEERVGDYEDLLLERNGQVLEYIPVSEVMSE
jgi:hypothetical protein